MAKKKQRYDSEMYFHGKKVGQGTVADGQSFTLLLEDCNGDPYEVLDRYMFFSPEVKQALEKSCRIYDKQKSSTYL